MKIPQEIIEKIKESADIAEIVGEFIALKKRGQNYIGLCPFHKEKTPSFTVSPDKGIYKCFGCGKAGNIFTFVQDYHGLNFFESVYLIASKYGIEIPKLNDENIERTSKNESSLEAMKEAAGFYAKLLHKKEGADALKYFNKRQFSDDLINKFLLGYSPSEWDTLTKRLIKNGFDEQTLIDAGLSIMSERGTLFDRFRSRAMFPIRDFMGRVVGFGARLMIDDKTQAKYINSPQSNIYDKSKILYGIFESKSAIRDKKFAIMVEGYADYLTLYQSGFENVVASSGTALTLQQLALLKRYTKSICFCYDGDSAGLAAALKGTELALIQDFDVSVIRLPEEDDPDTIIKKNGPVQMDYLIRDAQSYLDFKYQLDKESGNLESAQGLSNFVRSTVKTIVSIPDSLQHDFYIRKLSSLLDLSESQLRQVYKYRGEFLDELIQNDHNHENDYRKPEEFLVADTIQSAINYEDFLVYSSQLLKEEKIILKYALRGINELSDLIEKHDLDRDIFFSDTSKVLFGIIQTHSDKDDILDSIMADENLSNKIKSLAAEIALDGEMPSELWHKRFHADELLNDYHTIIGDSIVRLKLRQVQKSLKEVQHLMKEDENNIILKQRFIHLIQKQSELNSIIYR